MGGCGRRVGEWLGSWVSKQKVGIRLVGVAGAHGRGANGWMDGCASGFSGWIESGGCKGGLVGGLGGD